MVTNGDTDNGLPTPTNVPLTTLVVNHRISKLLSTADKDKTDVLPPQIVVGEAVIGEGLIGTALVSTNKLSYKLFTQPDKVFTAKAYT